MRRLWGLLAEHRDYRLLVTAGLVSGLGDHVLAVGLTFLVYGTIIVVIARFLPSGLLSLLDRRSAPPAKSRPDTKPASGHAD